ncbi:MAG: DUF4393 domain-containing protein [Ferruginibacter sp.]
MIEIEKYFKLLPITEIYKDLLKPGMKKAGEALGTVLDGANLILLPLKLINSKSKIYFEKNLEKYSDKLNANKHLTLTQVPQYVGLPIIDKLTYLDQNDLANIFINLLTKASFEETLKLVHPAYISILNNLSADEAKILFHYKNKTTIPFIDLYIHRYILEVDRPDFDEQKTPKTDEELKKMIKYTFQDKQDTFIKYAWNLTGIEKELILDFPENIDIYIENLQFNGLINFERKQHLVSDLSAYDKLIGTDYKYVYDKLKVQLNEIPKGFNSEIDIRRGYIEFTELGKGFLEACIKEID